MAKTAPRAGTSALPLLGRFQVLDSLGRGAQGEVLLAEDTRLKRQVAIKTLRPRAAQGAQAVRGLLDEALIVSQLAHPGIVPLFDAGEQDGRPWLVFEYAQGETLAALLKRAGPLPPERALDIAVQVLKAVGFAHARGIVHRDLKPANVMIGPDGNARIMFHAAVSQAADIFIEDMDGDKIRLHVPQWYRSLIPARSLLLFPVLVKGKPVGLLYADSDAGAIQLGAAELNLLKTLRNQAVLAIKQAS